MITIDLAAIPNQTLGIRLGDDLYAITVKAARGIMCADIIRNDIPIVTGSRIVSGAPLIPYRYLESGNFVIFTENDEYPDYTKFGDSQMLEYLSAEELGVIRG